MIEMQDREVIILSSSPPPVPSRTPVPRVEERARSNKTALITSSPPKLPRITVWPNASSTSRENVQFDDSIFDFLSSAEKPTKRRRLSPKPAYKAPEPSKLGFTVFELSSEPDIDVPIRKTGPLQRVQSPTPVVHDLDDIEDSLPSFSSSAPVRSEVRHATADDAVHTKHVTEVALDKLVDDDDDDDDDSVMICSQPASIRPSILSAETTALLAKLKKKTATATQTRPKANRSVTSYARASKSLQSSRSSMEVLDTILDSSQPSTAQKSEKSVSQKAKTGNVSATKRTKKTEAEKDAEKEQKQREKERKAAEKQKASDIAEVNKRKTDKTKAVAEMVIEVPNTLKGKSLGNKIEQEVRDLQVDLVFYTDEFDLSNDNNLAAPNLGNIIKWRRKLVSTYDEKIEEWIPLARKMTVAEKHVLVHLAAEDFCTIAAVGDGGCIAGSEAQSPTEAEMCGNLDIYMTRLRSRFANCTIILLIDGLVQWLKKSASAKNREYAAAVRAQPDTSGASTTIPPISTQPSGKTSRKRKAPPSVDLSYLNGDLTEALILHLQLTHQPLQIHHTTTSDCHSQIVAFTQHLSTRPYRNVELDRNIAHASFCMASGQFRTGGGDPADTWIKMLEQVNRLTVSYAKGIWDAGYESPAQLMNGFKKVERSVKRGAGSLGGEADTERQAREKAKLMLQDVRRAGSDKRIGPQMSKRLYKVFLGKDENMRDGIA